MMQVLQVHYVDEGIFIFFKFMSNKFHTATNLDVRGGKRTFGKCDAGSLQV